MISQHRRSHQCHWFCIGVGLSDGGSASLMCTCICLPPITNPKFVASTLRWRINQTKRIYYFQLFNEELIKLRDYITRSFDEIWSSLTSNMISYEHHGNVFLSTASHRVLKWSLTNTFIAPNFLLPKAWWLAKQLLS